MTGLLTRPGLLLRLEGLALLVGALALYWGVDGRWLVFALFFLAPDLCFFAYLVNKRVGAAAYNLVHTTFIPLGFGTIAVIGPNRLAGIVALIWLAHIGFDRLLGYGLKYETAFKDTHLGRV